MHRAGAHCPVSPRAPRLPACLCLLCMHMSPSHVGYSTHPRDPHRGSGRCGCSTPRCHTVHIVLKVLGQLVPVQELVDSRSRPRSCTSPCHSGRSTRPYDCHHGSDRCNCSTRLCRCRSCFGSSRKEGKEVLHLGSHLEVLWPVFCLEVVLLGSKEFEFHSDLELLCPCSRRILLRRR